jgi:hypothetical protein
MHWFVQPKLLVSLFILATFEIASSTFFVCVLDLHVEISLRGEIYRVTRGC